MTTAIPLKNTWTWLVTKPNGTGVTLLNKLTSNVQMQFALGVPAEASGDVPSDNPEINIPFADGDPFLAMNNRLLYGLRREGVLSTDVPYTCRFGGVIHIVEDQATTDEPVTHWTAYDPWMWLNAIPVFTSSGDLLGKNGLSFSNKRGSDIAMQLLVDALAVVVAQNPGNPIYIDVSSGDFEDTDPIDIDFQQGVSVGEAWTQLADTGSLDIVLKPVFDPASRPGKLAVLNIYNQTGSPRNNAIFAWDKMPHSLVSIDRLIDGTQMVNVGQYYANGLSAPQAKDTTSIARYGQYWDQQFYPAPSAKSAVGAIALAKVALRKRGKTTITVDPDPMLGPDPFTDYHLGDTVPVYAGRTQAGGGSSFRAPLTPGDVVAGEWTNPQRVYGFQLDLSNDEVETVTQLLLTDSNS